MEKRSLSSQRLRGPLRQWRLRIAGDVRKGDTATARGHSRADREAKLVASERVTGPAVPAALLPSSSAEWDPKCSQHEDARFKTGGRLGTEE